MSTTTSTWSRGAIPHIAPIGDSISHEASLSCVCRPELIHVPFPARASFVYFHNSLDLARGTERWETLR